MSIFANINESAPTLEETFKDPNVLVEAFIADEIACLPDEKIQEFCSEGGVGEELVQEAKLRRKTLVRLSKKDDLARRSTMACLQLAKEKNDPLWRKLVVNRQRKRDLVGKIKKKYSSKATKVAKVAQQQFLKGNRGKSLLPKSFMKAGGEDRLSKDN